MGKTITEIFLRKCIIIILPYDITTCEGMMIDREKFTCKAFNTY